MLRIIAVIKTLGKKNLALPGKVKKIYQESNENFLRLIEMIVEFNPTMQEHIHLIKNEKFIITTLDIIYKKSW